MNSEYLAAFQKTVAMHEVFLTRIASHSVMRDDDNFHVFLEFEKDVRTLTAVDFCVGFDWTCCLCSH